MIVLGIILLLLGYLLPIPFGGVLVTIGWILLIVGIILLLIGTLGPGVGGRRYWY